MSPAAALTIMLAAVLIMAALITFMIRRGRVEAAARLAERTAPAPRILAEHVVDMVSTHDADGTFRYVSPVFAGLLGEYPGQLTRTHPRDHAHPDDQAALVGVFRRAIQARGAPAIVAWRCRRHDGDWAWLETTARSTSGTAEELGAIVCASRDITERKQIEDALRDSEQRFRGALETVRLVALGLDQAARVTFVNEALLTLTGWARADLMGEVWFDRCAAPGEPARDAFFAAIENGTAPEKSEYEIICRDGRRRMISWDHTLLRSPGGDVAGTASLGADITERRQEEATMKLLQSITVAISAAGDLSGALAATLESLCAVTGWAFGEAWLPTSDGHELERSTWYVAPGVNAEPLVASGMSLRFARGMGLPGRAWVSRAIEWFTDLSDVPPGTFPRQRVAMDCGFRSALAVPVLSADEVVAILVFFMDRPRATDSAHTQMVFVVATQVGAVIERRRAQKRYEAELLRARDEAQAASRAKSDFLSRMSHELRTPLNSVIGFANVLRKNKGGRLSEEDLAFIQRIVSNGKHLLTLVNNVLDIAKVEAGRLTVTTTLVNIDQLLHEVVAQLEGQPREPGVELRAEAPDMVPIETDGVLMKQVLINLTGNALRFTKQGSVVLSAEVDANGVPTHIHVRDTGIGIPPDRQAAIFEPFEQATEDTHRTYGGTGLGLSISKAICDALGYRLTLVSEPGKGATFTVHLSTSSFGSNLHTTPVRGISAAR